MTPDGQPSGRSRTTQLIVLAVLGALLLVGVAIAISQSGGDDDEPEVASGDVQSLIDGLPQDGDTLGEPGAPETVLEFADLQCPFCRQFAVNEIPTLLEGPVSDGRLKLQFRNWVILGPDSEEAAAAALSAGEQDLLWNFVEAFYANQGEENSGYVTDEFLRGIAEDAGVPDLDQWEDERDPARWRSQLREIDDQATELGFSGTPSFALESGGEVRPLADAVTAADIEGSLSGG